MCNLKLQFRPTLPPRGNPARLPSLLLPVLALAALAQLALPDTRTVPPAGAVSRGMVATMPTTAAAVESPQILARRNLFSPSGTSGSVQAPPDPLNGVVIAGTVQQRSLRYALVQLADGRITKIAPGATLVGWRLIQLLPGSARLMRGQAVITVNYGQHPVPPTSPTAHSQSEDEQ